MIFGGTSTRVLDYALTTVLIIGNHKLKLHRKVAEGSGHLEEMGGRKWDENKSR